MSDGEGVVWGGVAGLVKGASQGEGLGNKFLANIRECDAIVQVGRTTRLHSGRRGGRAAHGCCLWS